MVVDAPNNEPVEAATARPSNEEPHHRPLPRRLHTFVIVTCFYNCYDEVARKTVKTGRAIPSPRASTVPMKTSCERTQQGVAVAQLHYGWSLPSVVLDCACTPVQRMALVS